MMFDLFINMKLIHNLTTEYDMTHLVIMVIVDDDIIDLRIAV